MINELTYSAVISQWIRHRSISDPASVNKHHAHILPFKWRKTFHY